MNGWLTNEIGTLFLNVAEVTKMALIVKAEAARQSRR